MRHFFRAEDWVPFPVETVFAFFANPANLPALMPRWQRARVEEVKLIAPALSPGNVLLPIAAGAGSLITITFCPLPLLPLRLPWDAVIVEFEWNRTFCDDQWPRGPFHYWRHRHTVTPQVESGISGTRVADDLEYELPLGVLGDIANRIFVGRQIHGIFAYRRRRLLELLAAPRAATPEFS